MGAGVDELTNTLAERYGRDVSAFAPTFLAESMAQRRKAARLGSDAEWLALLRADGGEAEAFVASLRVSHSELFRGSLTFAVLGELVLPALVDDPARRTALRRGRAGLRVWSAGCANGEEPYSIAILLRKLESERGYPLPHRIFATDSDDECLRRARLGAFSSQALRNVPLGHVEACFVRTGDTYSVAPSLRAHVDFSRHDLADASSAAPEASIFGHFDLILCCNVLYYYRADVQRVILDRLLRSLARGGYLVTGEAERALVESTGDVSAIGTPAPVFRRRSP